MAFVAVALVASQGSIDVSVLVWTAVGVFGVVFGITTVSSARHADRPSASVQSRAGRVAAAQAPIVRAAVSQTGARQPAASRAAASHAQAPQVALTEPLHMATTDPEPALPRRTPKHSAELPV
ncbi:hypothetical protein [Sinomonas cyclohexanicum]|uniref:hypothetical protein n=1 Tax=Sinomonas cyclohexanicum TaxID=322009 RepID=UPI001E297B0A|nr:hypothetical protein [Corynebacterium cyclohexanicum]